MVTRSKVFSWVHCGDVHLKDHENLGGVDLLSGRPRRMTDKLDALCKAIHWANDHEVNYFIVSGDMFDGPNPSERCLFELSCVLNMLDKNIAIVWLCGNHDTTGQYHAGQHIAEYQEGIYFHSDYALCHIDTGLCLHFFPWGSDIKEAVHNTETVGKFHVLIGHAEVRDSKMGGGKYCTDEKALDPDVLRECFDHIELTHFHTRQEFYIGSLARSTLGEAGQIKGFTFTEVFLSDGNYSVRSEIIDVHDREFFTGTIDELSKVPDEKFKGSIVKIFLPEDSPSILRQELGDKYRDLGALQVLTEKDKGSRVRKIRLAQSSMGPGEIVKKYGLDAGVSEQTLNLGLEIIKSCGA